MIDSYLIEKMFNNAPFLDEMATDQGKIYPHWERLAKYYDQIGRERMGQFHEEVGRQLRENGVTYNVYGDPNGMNRPWILDPVPMVFSSDEWEGIEKGLVQRTNLLNLVLSDLYGDQSLIKEGLIPFELVYNHKGFLRQAHNIKLDGDQQLIQYSSDLARGPDGKMWVLHDRTDAPSGAGYTFENRAAMTRVFPELIRENHVRKITSYYQTFKNTLSNLTTNNKENPRIALLSPGPTNETFFEHAYISSFMGFTLAFGEDLTVSDGYVWLKTIKGLEKVDVLIRRVDDVFCDPLEFRSDSHLGVVGLMEAVRQKKVLVINPLGSRVLENPGLMAFLPKLCRHLLGEDLEIPSVATWWCGQPLELSYVFENIESLVIRNIYRGTNNKSVFGGSLSKAELDLLKREIRRNPYLFVGQEMVEFSTTPAWINNSLEARNAVFRSYVVADSENKDYKVMPGGLSRSSPEKGAFLVSNQTGGISKDTWVLGKPKEAGALPVKAISIQPLVRNVLPSRTGERLFWLGRYLERSAYTVRLMRMALLSYNEADEDIHIQENPVLNTLLQTLTAVTGTFPGFSEKSILKNPEPELIALVRDVEKSGSLAYSIQSFLGNAYAVRDRLSLDTWRILDSISEELNKMRLSVTTIQQAYHSLDSMIVKLMAFYGLNIDNMTREPTWHLLNIGRFIESAVNNCTILRGMLSKSFDQESNKELMEDTLRCNESLVTYRYRYRSNLEMNGVLSLLMLHEDNPRALIYQLLEIDQHLRTLPNDGDGELFGAERKKLLEAITKIRLCDIDRLAEAEPATREFLALTAFLDEIVDLLHETSDVVYEKYFSHTGSSYRMMRTAVIPEI
ncbi:circularly permuted type 2 ATP-grasp protein [Algoriphagus aestuariicola]|uniref:Circularly permuted type 2 ATP-grasp protein n=1 Tax=Algoriphagus aestuariicola TaxID=1852016 RepID=A0ABS3BMU9_9BACT|nr:circularly permuted type 2 ATP-grasp protein [Algoriphagus aestuariicola]MBN7800597.1 circularly permuted type 2 ATP-grasp protein [Algoriphagus aestuariicola]